MPLCKINSLCYDFQFMVSTKESTCKKSDSADDMGATLQCSWKDQQQLPHLELDFFFLQILWEQFELFCQTTWLPCCVVANQELMH